ncbi:hypothetical protein JGS39_30345, partial [Streptomyces sp. P01-B04]|nr:hypothetical protein [Streptomyces poriferorum]
MTGLNPGPDAVMVRGPVRSFTRISNCAMKVPSPIGRAGGAVAVIPGFQMSFTGTPGGKSLPRTDVTNPGLPTSGTETMRGWRMRSGIRETLSPRSASVPVVVSVPVT